MKVLAIVTMFAFVAVQLSQSAPAPDEEKTDASVVPAVVPAADATSQPLGEAKAAPPEVVASPAEAAPHAEEKKA